MTKVEITVKFKKEVLDPEMSTLQRHLSRMNLKTEKIEQEKKYCIYFKYISKDNAIKKAESIANDFLANTEIHNCQIKIIN